MDGELRSPPPRFRSSLKSVGARLFVVAASVATSFLAASAVWVAPVGASGGSLTFTPTKGAPGTEVSASDAGTSLSCVNAASVSATGTSASATIDGNDGSQVVFTLPSVPQANSATVTLTNSSSPSTCDFSGTFQVVAPLTITTTALGQAGFGVGYGFRIRATGGVGPYSWALTGGSLPIGLVFNPDGIFSGSAGSIGTFPIDVTVTDDYGVTATAAFQLTVEPPPVVTSTTLPLASVDTNYSARLSATGGVPPYTWSVGPAGGLPGGLVVSSSGTISGRPGTASSGALDLQVTDSTGVSGYAMVPLTVDPASEIYGVAFADGALGVGVPPNAGPLLTVHKATGGVIALAARAGGRGFWALTRTGEVRGADGAPSLGSVPHQRSGHRPVAIAGSPEGDGYWVLTADGRVFPFGNAHRYRLEDAPRNPLKTAKAVSIAPSLTADGYWVLWSDGVVDAFGGAPVLGSVIQPHRTFVGIASMARSAGYWVLAENGRVFPFGAAWREPPSGGVRPHGHVVGIAGAPDGAGYWIVTKDGAIGAFGTARLPVGEANPVAEARAVGVAASG